MRHAKTALVAAATVIAGSGAVGAYVYASPGCWTARCQAEQTRIQEAAFAAGQVNVRAAWVDISNLVQQQVDIGRAITGAGRAMLEIADARTESQIDRISFLTSGLGPGAMLDLGRPYVEQAAALANQRDRRGAVFADSTEPVDRAIGDVQLTVRKEMVPSSATATRDIALAITALERGSTDALDALGKASLVPPARTSELGHALKTSCLALRTAVVTYDRQVTALAMLAPLRAIPTGPLFAAFTSEQERQLASFPATRVAAITGPPSAPRSRSGATGPSLVEQRARLSAESDIARINAQSEVLRRETLRLAAEGQAIPVQRPDDAATDDRRTRSSWPLDNTF